MVLLDVEFAHMAQASLHLPLQDTRGLLPLHAQGHTLGNRPSCHLLRIMPVMQLTFLP